MKALVKAQATKGIWLQDISEPTIGHNDVLIKVTKTAICGTDIHIYNWDTWAQKTIPVPLPIGHEFVGTITALGSEVQGFAVGDRVSGEGHLVCGVCRNCRAGIPHLCPKTKGIGVNHPGAFVEYLCMPASNLISIPDSIPDSVAAILDPFGNATHTALSFNILGEDVLITGAGPVGLLAIPLCLKAGARNVVITDINPYRLKLAEKLGATVALNVKNKTLPQVICDLGMTSGFDVGLEMSGNPQAFKDMLSNMHHGGKIALLGIPPDETAIDWNQVIFKGLHLKGIYGREMYETWYKMITLLKAGLDITPVITHEYHYTDFQKAFDIARSGQAGKVILNWS
jgi:threonine 3-dehydrogenase